MDSVRRLEHNQNVRVEAAPEEAAVLLRWKKRSRTVTYSSGLRVEAILYASEGAGWASPRTWPGASRDRAGTAGRLTGHEDVPSADPGIPTPERGRDPARTQKEGIKSILAQPPLPARHPRWSALDFRALIKVVFPMWEAGV